MLHSSCPSTKKWWQTPCMGSRVATTRSAAARAVPNMPKKRSILPKMIMSPTVAPVRAAELLALSWRLAGTLALCLATVIRVTSTAA